MVVAWLADTDTPLSVATQSPKQAVLYCSLMAICC